MSCEHLEHWYEDCRNCQRDAWDCVDDMRNQRNGAHATIAELRALLEKAARYVPWSAEDEARLDALGVDGWGWSDETTNRFATKAHVGNSSGLAAVVSEADFVLSGGDDPHDACPDCGLAGVGMLRDALNPARSLLEKTKP